MKQQLPIFQMKLKKLFITEVIIQKKLLTVTKQVCFGKMPNRTYIHKYVKQAPSFIHFKDHLILMLIDNAGSHMIKTGVVYT